MLWAMISVGLTSSQDVRWFHSARIVLASFALAFVAFFHPASAFAGSLQVRDTASVLSSDDRSQIESAVGRYPFDVRVLTSTTYADQAGFSRYVGSQVNAPNEVVVGIDPVHHHTQVHFGTGSRIAQSDWVAIERAGNSQFHDSRWAAGVIAILDQASIAAGSGASSSPSGSSSSSGGHGWAIGGVLMLLFVIAIPVIIIIAIVSVIRRFTGGSSGPSYGGPGYGGNGPGYGGGGPGYNGGPGYGGGGPGYGGGGGMGPVGGGLIGAGLGGVAGYELGKMEGERENRHESGGGGFFDSGSSNNDSGGSSNYDAGGGGSSWDSGGGGGDSGGGGDDSGGGGGDSGGGGGSDW